MADQGSLGGRGLQQERQRVKLGRPCRSGAGTLGCLLAVVWRLVSQLVLLFVTIQIYTWFRKTFFLRPASVAFAHAQQILDLEHTLSIDIELSLQQHVLPHEWLIRFFTTYYGLMTEILLASSGLAILFRFAAYRHWRRVFFLVTAIALPCYWMYPLAPPRLMASHGYPFVDTVAMLHHHGNSYAGTANPYASMPSMHVAWSIVAALMLASALPWYRLGAVLGAVHVSLIILAVIITANHYVLDVAGGGVVIALALALDHWLPTPLVHWRVRWRRLNLPTASRLFGASGQEAGDQAPVPSDRHDCRAQWAAGEHARC